MTAHETVVLAGDYRAVCHVFDAMRSQPRAVVFDLRSAGARKLWHEVAYAPRLDYGEETRLRANCHETDGYGWID